VLTASTCLLAATRAKQLYASHTQLYAPLLPLPSPRSPSPARRYLLLAQHASTRRIPDICNMHHTLFFVFHTHRDCGASSLADLRQPPSGLLRVPREMAARQDRAGGRVSSRYIFRRRNVGHPPRGRGRGVRPERVTRCCLLSVLVPMLAQMSWFQICTFALAQSRWGRFGRRGRELRCVLLRAVLCCAAWRCAALRCAADYKLSQDMPRGYDGTLWKLKLWRSSWCGGKISWEGTVVDLGRALRIPRLGSWAC